VNDSINLSISGYFENPTITYSSSDRTICSINGTTLKAISPGTCNININFLTTEVIFYNLINNKCVLSEKSSINYYGDMIVEFSGYQDMGDKMVSLIKDDKWKEYANDRFILEGVKY
jgi:hypothetical protein